MQSMRVLRSLSDEKLLPAVSSASTDTQVETMRIVQTSLKLAVLFVRLEFFFRYRDRRESDETQYFFGTEFG